MKHLRSAWVFLALLIASAVWADELTLTQDQKKIKGDLEKITESVITLKVDGKAVDSPVKQVLDLTLRPAGPTAATKYIEVQLIDESVLKCKKITFGAKDVQLDLTTGISVKAPITALSTILRDADDPAIRKQWTALMTDKIRKDRIFTYNGDQLNPLLGLIGVIDAEKQKIKFKPDDREEVEASIEKVHAMQFLRTEVLEQAGLCKVIDVEGNKLVAAKLAYDGKEVSVLTPFGQKVAVDPKLVSMFDFNLGRLTFLSDLVERMPDTTLLGGFNPLRKNRNLDGGDIMLLDKKYDKGLSMYAGVELEYDLAANYKDFKAILGVDSRIADEGQGKVTVTVYCDNENRNTYEVSVKAPTPIALNVKDVKTLKIVVSGSNFTNFSGHAMLANAHVSQ